MGILRLEQSDLTDFEAMQSLARQYARQGHTAKLRDLAWRLIQAGHGPVVSVEVQIVPVRNLLDFSLELERWLLEPVRVSLQWEARIARLFACDCAERVLHLYKAAFSEDTRPHDAIAVARRFARGKATAEELEITQAGVLAAGETAEAAWAAAGASAWVAARGAAWVAAEDAAWDAAGDAAPTAARAAAKGAEIEWQRTQLLAYLLGQKG